MVRQDTVSYILCFYLFHKLNIFLRLYLVIIHKGPIRTGQVHDVQLHPPSLALVRTSVGDQAVLQS